MNKRAVLIFIGVLAVVALLVTGIKMKPAPVEPTPTPTLPPTPVPCIEVNLVGGDSFFNEAKIPTALYARYKELGYCPKVLSNSGADAYKPNGDVVDYGFPSKSVNVLQPGTITAEQEMIVSYKGTTLPSTGDPKKINPTVTFARTPLPFFGKAALTEALIKASYAYVDNGVVRMTKENVKIIILADINGFCWKLDTNDAYCNNPDKVLGVDYPGPVKLGFGNPKSSGARGSLAFALSCIDEDTCQYTVTPEQIETREFQDATVQMIRIAAGLTGRDDSLAFCTNFFDNDSNPVSLLIAGESCYASWWYNMSDNLKQRNSGKNIPIYQEYLVVNEFPLIPLDQIGIDFVNAIAKDDIVRQELSKMGYQAGAYNTPPENVPGIDMDKKYLTIAPALPVVMNKIKEIGKAWDEGEYGK